MRETFELFKEITIISQLASAEFDKVLPDGLHPSHFALINHLATTGDGKTPMELARAFQISKQNMTNSVMRLGERGLIAIEDHPTDGRSKIVRLTPHGRDFQVKAVKALDPVLRDVESHANFEAFHTMLPALKQLRAFLDARRS
ncbi:MAG: winged helix DNA-binding protein [Blastochloris sp.]|nr:winged helix DNA-binding protein [Blastochloris sp.]